MQTAICDEDSCGLSRLQGKQELAVVLGVRGGGSSLSVAAVLIEYIILVLYRPGECICSTGMLNSVCGSSIWLNRAMDEGR